MGQVYVLFSRVTDPRHLELLGNRVDIESISFCTHASLPGLPPADILEDVVRAWQAAGLDVAECLQRAATVTSEWIYTPGHGNICDRFTPRLISERTVPVRHRDLCEVINPQPRALAVIRRLLDWIGRVDLASQRGGARPAFKTTTGEPIFPGEDDKWWLTDVQQRKKPEETQHADEDGPVSECEEQKEDTEDEDPTSEEDCEENNTLATGFQTDDAPLAQASIYFERQGPDARCGMHALNNAVGRPWQSADDMAFACDEFLRASQQESSME